MHADLPRSDYILAGLVAVLVSLAVASVTVLPAIVFFNWLAVATVNHWAKLVPAIPIACGLAGAWSCLRRAKSDRVRDRLLRELRD